MPSLKSSSGTMDGGDNLRFGRAENTPVGTYSGLTWASRYGLPVTFAHIADAAPWLADAKLEEAGF